MLLACPTVPQVRVPGLRGAGPRSLHRPRLQGEGGQGAAEGGGGGAGEEEEARDQGLGTGWGSDNFVDFFEFRAKQV